jgi:hypothetical protein
MSELVEIRCPIQLNIKDKHTGRAWVCNRLCVRVAPGSKGQAFCPRHDKSFDFEVEDHAKSVFATINSEREATENDRDRQ